MSNIEKIAVFGFGIIFLSAILVLVVLIPMPSITQFFAFRLTMALSAAGIGALLPGFLRLDVPLPMQGGIRAGGALALFASVWFANRRPWALKSNLPRKTRGSSSTGFLILLMPVTTRLPTHCTPSETRRGSARMPTCP
ncbi:hypothetical protein [Methylogaea oryzae]|uniref:hypothetical protein n=1 Tax=Methylogaea oryzae TaxID=1295382 RepID=UPI0020D052A1|nr:hypothetical protein [Methylogaea oryzae]